MAVLRRRRVISLISAVACGLVVTASCVAASPLGRDTAPAGPAGSNVGAPVASGSDPSARTVAVADRTVPAALASPAGDRATDPAGLRGADGHAVVANFADTQDGPVLTRRTVGWTWVAPITGSYRFTTHGSEMDTILTATPQGGAPVTDDDEGDLSTSAVTVDATAGQTVTLSVTAKDSSTGLVFLAWAPVTTSTATAPAPGSTPEQLGTPSTLYPEIPFSTTTGDKPQSKLWVYGGVWYAVAATTTVQPAGTWLFAMESGGWRAVLYLGPATDVRADALAVGDVTHVLLYGPSTTLVSLQYDTTAHGYRLWSQRTSATPVSLPGSEIATIAIDSTGRMWLAYDPDTSMAVRYADAPYTSFSAPVVVATGTTVDDIADVVAMNGAIGVLWSNQVTKRFGFRTHVDGAPPTTWTADEVPASRSAGPWGHGMADDHIHMSYASDGTLYASIKTSYDTAGVPVIELLVRRPNGLWDDARPVDTIGTRPITLLNEQAGTLTIVYTASTNLDKILVKTAPLATLDFSARAATLISGKHNNATSTKQSWQRQVVAMAGGSSTAAYAVITQPGLPTATGSTLRVSQGSSASGTLTGTGAPPLTYEIVTPPSLGTVTLDDASTGAFTYTAPADRAGSDSFTFRVGSGGQWSDPATVAVTVSPASGLVGLWQLDEGTGLTAGDTSGLGHDGTLTGGTTWTTGQLGGALRLDGTGYVTIPDADTLDPTTALTITAWVRPATTTTAYIVKKATQNTTNGYELGLSSTGTPFLRLNQATSGDTYRVNATSPIPTNGTTWTHLAATYDGTTLRLYVNGTLQSSLTKTTTIATNTLPLTLGAEPGGYRPYTGTLDDIHLYDHALTPTQITTLMTGSSTDPVAADGSSQVTAGSSVSGTLSGTAGSGTDPVSYAVVTGPTKGTVVVTDPSTGSFTYTPSAGQVGTDTFTYQLTQGTRTSNVATWTVTISAADGLVAAWNLDDASGTVATDSSGFGNDATTSGGPAWTTGVHGGALQLDGVDDWASAPDAPSLDATTALTISAWVRPQQLATQYLVKKAVSGTTNGYELGLSSSGTVFLRLNQATKGDTYRVDSVTPYPTDGRTWTHVAGTYDGTTLRLYVNGTLEGSAAGPAAVATNGLPLTIGAEPGGTRPVAAALDDVRVYAAALSATQVTDLAAPPAAPTPDPTPTPTPDPTPTPTPASGLVGLWQLDEGTGLTAGDTSGLGHDGTLTGGTTWTTGQLGGALRLDGTGYVTIPDADTLDPTTALTITAWVRPATTTTAYIVKKATQNTTNGYELGLSSTGTPFLRLNQATSGDTYRVNATSPIPTNGTTWTHLAATYDGTTLRLYVNGTLQSSLTKTTTIATNTLPLTLGAEPGGYRPYTGTLDDIHLYDHALTPTQITTLMTGG